MNSTQPAPVQPFWERFPETLLFPMQRGALFTLLFLTLGQLIGWLPIPFVGFLVSVLLTMAMFHYASECLSRAAHGDLEAPEYSSHTRESEGWSHMLLQFLLFGSILAVAVFIGIWPALALMALVAYAMPAAIILLTMTRSIGEALNPMAWLEIIGKIGAPYILLAAMCLAYFIAGMFASVYFASLEGLFLIRLVGSLLSWFAMQYMVIACFHLMGYVVLQYADRLGHEIVSDALPTTLPNLRADPDQPLVDETRALSEAGRNDEARRLLLEHMSGRGATPLAHEHYRQLVKRDNDTAALVDHGRRYIPVLAAQHNDKRAVEVFAETVALDRTFRPDIADEVFRVASRATLMGQHQLALHLLDGFHTRHPKHPDVVRNLLLAARICHDRLGNAAQAQKILDFVAAKWPGHPHAAEHAALSETVAATLRVTPPGG